MARPGTFTAYQRLRPIEEDFSDNFKEAQDLGFEYAKLKRLKDQDEQAQAEKDQAQIDDMKVTSTGYNNVDEMIADAFYNDETGLIKKLIEAQAALKKDPTNTKAQLEVSRLMKMPEEIARMSQGLIAAKQTLEEGITNGTLHPKLNEGVLQNYDASIGKMNGKFLYKNGSMQFVPGAFDMSEEEYFSFVDPKSDKEGITMRDILNGDLIDGFAQKWDAEEWIKSKVDLGIGTFKETKQKGFTTEETQKIKDGFVKGLERELDSLLGTTLKDANWRAESLFADYDLPIPKNEAEFQSAKEDLINRIASTVDETESTTIDQSAATARVRENRLGREDKPEPPSLGESVTPTQKTWGSEFDNIDTAKVYSVNMKGSAVIPALKVADDEFLTNAKVENATINKSGNLVLDVSYQETKSKVEDAETEAYDDNDDVTTTKTKTTTGPVNKKKVVVVAKEDEAEVADQLGITIGALKSRIYIPDDNDPAGLFTEKIKN